MNDYNNNNSIQSLDDQESQPLIEPIQSCFHPSKKFYRFFGLIFICLLTFGPEGFSYFCFFSFVNFYD